MIWIDDRVKKSRNSVRKITIVRIVFGYIMKYSAKFISICLCFILDSITMGYASHIYRFGVGDECIALLFITSDFDVGF